MRAFQCISYCPADARHAGLAIATIRANGVGILDFEFCSDAAFARGRNNLNSLFATPEAAGRAGIRVTPAQLENLRPQLETLADLRPWLVVCDWTLRELESLLAGLPERLRANLVVEITDASSLGVLEAFRPQLRGLVAKGSESGGWVGTSSSFILLQKVLAATDLPVFVQGGIGLGTAAACRCAGAAGVVLDDQLLLMPESPLPDRWKEALRQLGATDTIPIGERLGEAVRVVVRPGFDAAASLQKLADALESEEGGADHWRERAAPLVGWGEPRAIAWPVGQAIALAAAAARHGTTGRYLQALLRESQRQIEVARLAKPLAPESPLAESHATLYPIVQGPMTRVSDVPDFAEAVARNGALPLLALAMMRNDEALRLLESTRERMGAQPWGVGILGFVPQDLRDEQLAAISKIRPDFALIAGGRPDQASQLESRGIATYIHVPTPQLMQIFLQQGARRFVFEGRECGGHVGPLSSFTLWESMVEILLGLDPKTAAGVHVLFAGGIHDARSAAMVSVLAARLVERGIKIGVLMGSAYLFTNEAVSTGAILPGFQEVALGCSATMNLETGPGHASRCAVTAYGEEFHATRQRMLSAGATRDEIRVALEELTLGRLRVATKGKKRIGEAIVDVDAATQQREGMYMLGEAASLRQEVCSLADLHREVSEGSTAWLAAEPGDTADRETTGRPAPSPSDVAIVGIGLLLPKATDADSFWENIVHKVDAIGEIPPERWDWRMYYSADRTDSDKVSSKWGGFLEEISFDPLGFGIPPSSMKFIDPMQLLALEVTQRALADAGYANGDFDRENTCVILGLSGGMGDLGQQYVARSEIPRMVGAVEPQVLERLPQWSEESFPGVLPNVTAGRIANRFDFGGRNFTVDAACASSLAAVDLAVAELESGRCNVALAGGVDTIQSPFGYFCFSETQALSPTGRIRAFDREADGIVISEGVAFVVLKRLADAERDGDRIYSVIKAVSGTSDGKGKSMTAPAKGGQTRAMLATFQKAGVEPRKLGLYEAHGTGTVLGDQTELAAISEVLRADGTPPRSCAVGSVKTLIGHTKSTAGVAGLIKAALSLHYKTLPPHSNVESPLPEFLRDDSPVYLLSEATPWIRTDDEPRRAGVSAFGFGGTNYHAVLEEYRERTRPEATGGRVWPNEIFAWSASDSERLREQLLATRALLEREDSPRLRDVAFTVNRRRAVKGEARAGVVASSESELADCLDLLIAQLDGAPSKRLPRNAGLETSRADAGKVAFLFPGQASQYPSMAREIALYFGEMADAIEEGGRTHRDRFDHPLSQLIHPYAVFSDEERDEQVRRQTDTHVAQTALGVVEAGYLALLRRLGVEPDMAAGHSFGEYAALYAAGAMGRDDFLRLGELRGRVMAEMCARSESAMAAVNASRADLAGLIEGNFDVILANHNAPQQTVISGAADAVRRTVFSLEARGLKARLLPVAGAFHSELMGPAEKPLSNAIRSTEFASPAIPVYSNLLGAPYPFDPGEITELLCRHLLGRVDFVDQVNAMYEDGARTFIEVGPSAVLTSLVQQILEGREATLVPLDRKGPGMRDFLCALNRLHLAGFELRLDTLFDDRGCQLLGERRRDASREKDPTGQSAWLVSGGSVRRTGDAPAGMGIRPPLDAGDTNHGRVTKQQEWKTSAPAREAEARATATGTPATVQPRTAGCISADPLLAAYEVHQQTMREFLRLQDDIMQQFMAALSGAKAPPLNLRAGEVAVADAPPRRDIGSPIPQVAPPTAAAETRSEEPDAVDAALGRDALLAALLEIVSDRTGYPTEMLGVDMDLEADLGIDSIKRVEMVGELLNVLPTSVAEALRADQEELTRAKTLNELIDRVTSELQATPGLADERQTSPQEGKPVSGGRMPLPDPAEGNGGQRYLMRARAVPLAARRGVGSSLYLVTEDSRDAALQVCEAIEASGAKAAILPAAVLREPAAIDETIARLRREHGPVAGIVHLAALTEEGPPSHIEDWRALTELHFKCLFHVVRVCAEDLRKQHGTVLSVSAFDGSFGRGHSETISSPSAGAAAGLLKTMALEWPEVSTKVIDTDRVQGNEVARICIDELCAGDGLDEIGYRDGQRRAFEPVLAPVDRGAAACAEPQADWVVLAIGGSRGITAEIVRELIVEGMTLVLVGQSEVEPEAFAGLPDAAALKRFLLEEALSSSPSPTPAEIERRIERIQRDRSVRRNLAAFREAGAHVEYHAVDVRAGEAFGLFLQSLYTRHGRLDAVIHGAGVIDDRQIVDKTRESLDRVFDTKADSTFVLARHLQSDSLKLMVLQSSVAGRTGNAGQADYAAANEVMNRFAWWMQREWPQTRVVSLNWGPWDVTGMASEAVNHRFRARGVIPLTPEVGRSCFREEVAHGRPEAVEVIAGVFGVGLDSHPGRQTGPLLGAGPCTMVGETISGERTFSLCGDPYLDDHRLKGNPVVPATVATEVLAEFVGVNWPEWKVAEVRDLRVLRGIILHEERPLSVTLRARPLGLASAERLEVRAEIVERDQARPSYSATVVLRPEFSAPVASIFEPLKKGDALDPTLCYADYCFHGPSFQVVVEIPHCSGAGMDAIVQPTEPERWLRKESDHTSKWLFDPVLMDGAMQCVLIWCGAQHSVVTLPARFSRLVRYQSELPKGLVEVRVRVREFSRSGAISDLQILDNAGNLLLQLEKLETTHRTEISGLTGTTRNDI